MSNTDFLSIDAAARRLGHSRPWLYRKLDQIPTVKIGGRRFVPARALDELIEDIAAGRKVIV